MDTIDYSLLFSGTRDYYVADIYNLLISYLGEATLAAFSLTNKFVVELFGDVFWLSYVRKHRLELLLPLQYWFGSLRQFCLRILRESYYVVPVTSTKVRIFTDIKLAYECIINDMAIEMAKQNIVDVRQLTKVFNIMIMFVDQWNVGNNDVNHVIWSTSTSHKSYMNHQLLQYPSLLSNKLAVCETMGSMDVIEQNIIPHIALRPFVAKTLQSLDNRFLVVLADIDVNPKEFNRGKFGTFYHKGDDDLLILQPTPSITDKYTVAKVDTRYISYREQPYETYLQYYMDSLSELEVKYKNARVWHGALSNLYSLLSNIS